MKLCIINQLENCFQSWDIDDICDYELWHYHDNSQPTFLDSSYDYFEVSAHATLSRNKAMENFNNFEEARDSLKRIGAKSILKQIAEKSKRLEGIGCYKNYTIWELDVTHLIADNPKDLMLGVVSYVEVAIVGEKIDIFKIFGFRT